jgi:hypothetical protein
MKGGQSTSSGTARGAGLLHTLNIVPGWILSGLVFLFLVSCTSSGSVAGTTPRPAPPPSSNQLSTTPMPQLTQQYEFTERDSGRMVTYIVTSRFGIILNQQKYPKKQIQVSCTPAGTLGSISNLPSVAPPLYAVRYEGVQPGICTIRNGPFFLSVKILAARL